METIRLRSKSIAATDAYMSPMHDDEDDDFSSDEENLMEEIDTDDDGGDYETQPQYNKHGKRLQSLSSNDELFHNVTSKIPRLPTRRPNPKISNRNALMARENRRKKKEHLENLQKNVDDTQNENKKLKKMLRIRNNTITKLHQESLYLRSILANKTEIMSLLKTIQGNRTPITSSTLSFMADETNYQCNEITSNKRTQSYNYTSSGGVSPLSSISTQSMDGTEKENGTRTDRPNASDPFLSSIFSQPYSLFTDLDSVADDPFGINDIETASPATPFGGNVDDNFQWQHLLSDTSSYNCSKSMVNNDDVNTISDLRDIDDSEILSTHSNNNVNNEHNYFNNPIAHKVAADVGANTDSAKKPGICLHISSGRVSLEFCAACHMNSQNAWIEEM